MFCKNEEIIQWSQMKTKKTYFNIYIHLPSIHEMNISPNISFIAVICCQQIWKKTMRKEHEKYRK